jgi:ABC-type transporter Mla subunit MlaD
LSSLIEDSARQLDGQGQQLNETLSNFAKLSTTLSNNKEELFGSIQEIEQFVALLNRNDSSVRSFFDSTARVSRVLEGERDDLAKTLEFLSKALIDVRKLVKDNRTTLRHNIDNLQSLAEVLARHNEDIEHTLVDAPIALGNLGLAGGSSKTGTLDARSDIAKLFESIEPTDLPGIICNLLGEAIPPGEETCPGLGDLLEGLALPGGLASTAQDGPATGGAGTPKPDETLNELTDLLGVNP